MRRRWKRAGTVEDEFELAASVSEQEQVFLSLAAGSLSRETLVRWLEAHVCQTSGPA